MTFVVHRSERADVLADVLAEVLLDVPDDPFAPEVVSVHARGVERWLAHRLSARLGAAPDRSDGVCANLRFPFPGRLVGDALAVATGVDPATDDWRPERLAWPLLDVVESALAGGEPWLEVLAGHVGGFDPAAADRDRRFAAVRHLADLFDRYATHRPAMLLRWAAGEDTDDTGVPLPADATWQAELWRRLRSTLGTPSPAERLAGGCDRLRAERDLVDLPARLSLFGFTRLPSSWFDVLAALAEHRDVHLFALHPSPAAWQAVEASGGGARHPLLRSWGKDSLDMQRVLLQAIDASGTAFRQRHHAVDPPERPNLLQRLQLAVRSDEPPAGGPPPAEDDRSIQVHACHGRARQAEVVRDAITHLLAADDTLEPRDVVVMCPDIDEFAPLLHAAFDDRGAGDGGAPSIPYRLADRSLRQTNPVLGALAELLDLASSRLTASQVLSFASLAPVRTRFELTDRDLERLGQWVGQTGTRWGIDAAHREPFGLGAVPTGTWERGLTRLLLGVTMSEDDLRLVGGALPLDDVDGGDIDRAGRVAELVARLGTAVRSLGGPHSVAGWVARLDAAADALFATRATEAWQRTQLDHLLDDVAAEAGIADRRALASEVLGGTGPGGAAGTVAPAGAAPPTLRLAELRDLLGDRLRGQPTRAAFRTGDLTMCTLVPMRSVPHRVVCIVGLDDGAFPRGGAPDGDDLLARNPRLGDHDRRTEDRQLLLDAVLAAGDALVLTYAGRDVRTNEELPPAVPLAELLDVLEATAAGAREHVVRHHPLHPADPRCFAAEAPWGFDRRLLDGARAAAGERSRPGPFLDPARPLPPPEPSDVLALEDLDAFLRHPARSFLRRRLALSFGFDDDRPSDRLAVQLDSLESWSVGERLLEAALAGTDLDVACRAEEARGLLPPGRLGRDALKAARDKAGAVVDRFRASVDAAAVPGAATGPVALDIDLVLPDGRRLVGTVPGVDRGVIAAATTSSLAARHRTTAWLRLLAATAATTVGGPVAAVTVGTSRGAPSVLALPPLDDPVGALDALAVVVDLFERNLRHPLPIFPKTSYAWARAPWDGRDPFTEAVFAWESRDWAKEDQDPEHVRLLGGVRPLRDLLDEPPAADEAGPGWAMDETSRFGRLARRVWDPILRHELAGRR